MVMYRRPLNLVKLFKKWTLCLCIVTVTYGVLVHFTDQELIPSRVPSNIKLPVLQHYSEYARNKSSNDNSLKAVEKRRQIKLEDIFISVKTSGKFYAERLEIILKTWFQLAPSQIFFFTDSNDDGLQKQTAGHLINTGCGKDHSRTDLTCKMGAEYDFFMTQWHKWWCHFDDDNYVNIEALVTLLQKFDHEQDIYVGKLSMLKPITSMYLGEQVTFYFATGGAGMCISKNLAKKMSPWCSRGALLETSQGLRFPDDCTIGFVITNRLSVNLTQSSLFHSHLESLSRIAPEDFREQVSFSYHLSDSFANLVSLEPEQAIFNSSVDPTRFLSLHCILYPSTSYCKPN